MKIKIDVWKKPAGKAYKRVMREFSTFANFTDKIRAIKSLRAAIPGLELMDAKYVIEAEESRVESWLRNNESFINFR